MKTLAFIAMSKNTTEACTQQLHQLLGTKVNIISYSINNEKKPLRINADLVLFASREAYIHAQKHCNNSTILIARRSIDYHEVDKLFAIPIGTDVLLVNDLPDSANKTIALLQTIGIDQINYHPYSPQMTVYHHCKIAITPGEKNLVPDFIENIIDIKTRLIDITTIIEVLLKLNILDLYADFLSANYVKDIINISKNSYHILNEFEHFKENIINKKRTKAHAAKYTFDKILGNSELLINVINNAKKMSKSSSPILIEGESGTGKEFIAQSIHNASPSHNGPFIAVNFAALSETLLESELFGYVPGAFTGAKREGSIGLFEEANNGTIFLDEIGDAPLSFQIKLLRVLQEKQIRRIGGNKIIPINVRVITATNHNLAQMVEDGLFRMDLYYRLNILPINMPPLRKRGKDILMLADSFYQKQAKEHNLFKYSSKEYFSKIVVYLLHYNWPGNIRELENIVEYLTTLSPEAPPGLSLLPPQFQKNKFKDKNTIKSTFTTSMLKKMIINEIIISNNSHNPIGRRSLSNKLHQPENRIRVILNELKNDGTILARRGRSGLIIKNNVLNDINV